MEMPERILYNGKSDCYMRSVSSLPFDLGYKLKNHLQDVEQAQPVLSEFGFVPLSETAITRGQPETMWKIDRDGHARVFLMLLGHGHWRLSTPGGRPLGGTRNVTLLKGMLTRELERL